MQQFQAGLPIYRDKGPKPAAGKSLSSAVFISMLLYLLAITVQAEDKNAQMRSMIMANGHLGECSSCHGRNDPTRFKLDPRQSRILFKADNFGYGPVFGEFGDFDGGFKFDPEKGELQSVVATVRANSINMGDALLNAVVRERFVMADSYPLLTFVASDVKHKGKHRSKVMGELTMLGVTRPVVLDVTLNRSGNHPLDGRMTAGFSVTGSIRRSDYGLALGSPVIGDEIMFEIVAIGSNVR